MDDESRPSWTTSAPSIGLIVAASAPMVAALLCRSRAPVLVCACLAVYSAFLTLLVGTRPLITLLVALYSVTALRSRKSGLLCLAAVLAAHAVAVAYESTNFLDPPERLLGATVIALFFAVCDVATWGVGRRAALAGRREQHLEELRDSLADALREDRKLGGRDESRRGVFVSYRTADTGHAAGRLGEELVRELGSDRVFIDVVSIRPGSDFRADIAASLAQSVIMLVVIGHQWLRPAGERSRLEDPGDVLRIEVEQALHTGVQVIPLLVDGASMPRATELPETLRSLTRRSALTMSARTFRRDAEEVISIVADALRGR